jgi:prepilin-type N-terminal cleavage/methylation domain-containing protein
MDAAMRNQNFRPTEARLGFSIVELIVAMAIIGILVLILVPVVSNRTREARLRAAESDLEHLANALERVGIDTNYMFKLYVLDDVIGGDGVANQPTNVPAERIDGTRDEDLNPVFAGQAERIFISLETQQVVDLALATSIYNNQFAVTTDLQSETKFGWHGPYINWQVDKNYNDWPDDPWGRDYIFFTRAGGMGPLDTQFVLTGVTIGTSMAPISFPAQANVFDRPTVLSLGPDGLPGDGAANPTGNGDYGEGDDIFRKF